MCCQGRKRLVKPCRMRHMAGRWLWLWWERFLAAAFRCEQGRKSRRESAPTYNAPLSNQPEL